nr:hypothetical protein [Tanacetum cinerariifolium]
KAIGLVMADVVLVNVEGPYPVALQNLRKEIAATHIMAFGKNLLDVAVRTTQIYEPVQFPAVGLAYLAGAEVEMVEYDTSLKKRLWETGLFGVPRKLLTSAPRPAWLAGQDHAGFWQ